MKVNGASRPHRKSLQDSLFTQHRADFAHARVPRAVPARLDARVRSPRLCIIKSRGAGLLKALRVVRDVDDPGKLQHLIRLARGDNRLSRGQILVEFEWAHVFTERSRVKVPCWG